jgi:hypothetical protein
MVRALANPSSRPGNTPWYLWPNLLGLDAPLVAILWCWFYADVQGISLPAALLMLLGGAVWSIYTIDRLLDARYIRLVGAQSTERHRFAVCHRRAFLAGLVTVIAAGLYGAGWVIPAGILYMGLALLLAGLFYFLLVWSPRLRCIAIGLRVGLATLLGTASWLSQLPLLTKILYSLVLLVLVAFSITRKPDSPRLEPPKELVSGLIFALGVILPASFYTPGGLSGCGGRIVALWAICTLNCLCIAWSERQIDRHADPAALPQRFPWIGRILPLLCALTIPLCAILYRDDPLRGSLPFYCACSISSVCLMLLALVGSLVPRTRQRVLADAALLTPLFFAW